MKPINVFGFEVNKTQIIGAVIAVIIIILDVLFLRSNSELFYFILGISFIIVGFPFFLYLILESRQATQKESMFLEFSRDLVGNVKAGTPISKAILNIRKKDYGVLTPHIDKLANQISLGIPIETAFKTFARDLNSNTITRAINIISESQKAGGEIEAILDAVVSSVTQMEKLIKERRSAMYTLVVQGYIIFLIFIVIMLVMEFQILPIASGFGDIGDISGDMGGLGGIFGGASERLSAKELAQPFFWLLIIQGFFTGLVIGKLSEGKVKSGLKHSFILLVLAILINTGAKVAFKGAEIAANATGVG
ncbi:MAG: type II secretion system F family protein [archaeon]